MLDLAVFIEMMGWARVAHRGISTSTASPSIEASGSRLQT
jgi:hypothetical protein